VKNSQEKLKYKKSEPEPNPKIGAQESNNLPAGRQVKNPGPG